MSESILREKCENATYLGSFCVFVCLFVFVMKIYIDRVPSMQVTKKNIDNCKSSGNV